MSPFSAPQFVERIGLAFREGDPDAGRKEAEARNVGVLQGQYRAIARGDLAAALELLHDEVEFEITGPPAVPFLGRWRGRAEVGAAIGRNFAMVEDQHPEIQAVVAQGDTVIVVARERGRVRATGRPYDLHWVQVFTFRDGKAVRIREIVDGLAM